MTMIKWIVGLWWYNLTHQRKRYRMCEDPQELGWWIEEVKD